MNNLTPFLAAANSGTTLTPLDWLAIAVYFGILLAVAWWVVRKSKDNATDYFLAGRNLSWWVIGASIFASNIGSEHIVGLAGSGAKDGVAMAHYELHAWCLLVLAWVFVPFYARSLVFTMPEFLERRFSPALALRALRSCRSSRSLSPRSPWAFSPGGGVSNAAAGDAPEFGHMIDSFWIGSVLVIVLTGLYTMLGRHARRGLQRRRAGRPDRRLGAADLLRPGWATGGLGRVAADCAVRTCSISGSRSFPKGVEGTWAPWSRNASGDIIKEAWYFNGKFPLAGHGHLRAGHRAVVLVYRPIYRAARLGRAQRADRPARQHLRRFSQAVSGLSVHHSRPDLLRAGQERQGAGTVRHDPARATAMPARTPRRPLFP
jgi:SSS family solute:Na+ symporter